MVSILNVMFKKIYKENKDNEVKNVSSLKLVLQIAIQAAVIMIFSNILRKTVRSIPYPFDIQGWELMDDPIFTFKGQFYKGKHHWQSEGGGIYKNRVFRFTSCKVKAE